MDKKSHFPRIPILLVDIDGVLADFHAATFRLFGTDPATFYARHAAGYWDVTPGLGVDHEGFWSKIREAGADFWAELEPLPWTETLLGLAFSVADAVYLVSDPHREDAQIYAGKMRWIHKHLGGKFHNYVLTGYKFLLSRPGTVLLDDSEKNLQKFTSLEHGGGGSGILFPSRHNRLYPIADEPMPYVIGHIKELRHALAIPKS